MKDKKMLLSAILITSVMLFAGGCGKQTEPVSAEPTSSPTALPEESMEGSEAPSNSENETIVEDEDEAIVEDDVVVEDEDVVKDAESTKTESTKTESAATAPTGTATPASTPETAAPASTPEPVHTHAWKEHTATEQTWIPNIVVVDDYETQTIKTESYICYCGFETTDSDTIAQHIKDHVYADELEFAGFTIQTHTQSQEVKVGSHEEDMGHYETSTYVDYYYCDCGATK